MLQNLIWLLLPVAAASGWWLAKRSQRKQQAHYQLQSDYFKGINYFLNEQPDKAIDVFIQMLEVDSETVEPHMALGNLFRRRGEVDRAIRIHQNLIARPALTKEQRNQALLELSNDYLQAGLLDRAENLLEELIGRDGRNTYALRLLKVIYEQEHEWHNAITVAHKLESVSGTRQQAIVAQYYCELAEQAISSNEPAKARKIARKASSLNTRTVRPYLILAQLDYQAGHFKAAIKGYKRALQQQIGCLPDIIEPFINSYRQLAKQQDMESFLSHVIQQQTAIQPALVYSDYLQQQHGAAVASHFLTDFLGQHPSLYGIEHLLKLIIEENKSVLNGNGRLMLDSFEQLLSNAHLYSCSNCGFSANKRYWQCPGCKQWETVQPVSEQPSIVNESMMTAKAPVYDITRH